MGDLDELRTRLEHKKNVLLEKERQLRQQHENVTYEHFDSLLLASRFSLYCRLG